MSVQWHILIWSLRVFYLCAASSILFVRNVPAFRTRYLDYGARAQVALDGINVSRSKANAGISEYILDEVAKITVPHNWFTHFYVLSSIMAAFWNIVLTTDLIWDTNSAKHDYWRLRVRLMMFFMLLHSVRRLYECVHFTKPSKSRMWIGHYVIGIVFYLVTNVAIWIDTSKSNLLSKRTQVRS